MKNDYNGPFFKKTDEGYVLSDICKECAFGDEISCCLNPCIYFCAVAENTEEEGELHDTQRQVKQMTDRVDIPGIETIKIKRQIPMSATRCLVCGKWESPEFNSELYDPVIMGETSGLCKSCRKAIEWAKERMEDEKNGM